MREKHVKLFPVRGQFDGWHNFSVGPRPVRAKSALPFFATRRMSRFHRVRSLTTFYHWDKYDSFKNPYVHHVSVHAWCGQATSLDKGAMLREEPLDSWPVCAMCEAKAMGAGQVDSKTLTGRTLIFTPRKAA